MVGLELDEAYQSELAEIKAEWERVCKLYLKMREVAVEKKDKEATQIELDKVTKKHIVQLDKIIRECHAKVTRTKGKELEALEKFKEETSRNVYEDPIENDNVTPPTENDNVAHSAENDNVTLPIENKNASQVADGGEEEANVS
ncbi:hypothetical protein J1N35_014728 [Gossypium stocksii]|uniref:Uncharacterized protein n=1 Tax=Gossypium stocksii TaxID=47602 RepID=A0A9D4AA67_9ROSI|nr:hypothetical protein J1N35_014728 [Gossypium stocksii]